MTSMIASPAASQLRPYIQQEPDTRRANLTGPAAARTAPPSDPVVISLSKGTLSAAVNPSDATAEQRINSLFEQAKSYNGRAWLQANVDWDKLAELVGPQTAGEQRAQFAANLSLFAADVSRQFGESGINLRTITEGQSAETGLAPRTLLVRDFSFDQGGLTYNIASRDDGSVVGTRNGEAWKTWQTIPGRLANSDAILALLSLKSFSGVYREDDFGALKLRLNI